MREMPLDSSHDTPPPHARAHRAARWPNAAGGGTPAIHIVPADLSSPEEAQRLFDEVVGTRQLQVTMLVANAGIGHTEAFLDAPFSKISELVTLNALSLTQLARLFGRGMAERGCGRIMTVSSIAGAAPGPLVSVYSATKAYVTSFTQALQVGRMDGKKKNGRPGMWCTHTNLLKTPFPLKTKHGSTSWSRGA